MLLKFWWNFMTKMDYYQLPIYVIHSSHRSQWEVNLLNLNPLSRLTINSRLCRFQAEMNFVCKILQIKSKCHRAFRLSFGTLSVCLMQQCYCPAVEQDTFSHSLSPVCPAKLMLSDRSPCHRLPVAQSPAILMTHPTLIRPQTTLRVWVLFPGPAVDITCPPLPWSSQTRPSVCGRLRSWDAWVWEKPQCLNLPCTWDLESAGKFRPSVSAVHVCGLLSFSS